MEGTNPGGDLAKRGPQTYTQLSFKSRDPTPQIQTSAEIGEEHRVGRDEFHLHLEMGWEGFMEVVAVELGLEG